MAPFLTGTITPNPRHSVIYPFNKIPTKDKKLTPRKPSFLASDHTDATSGKKTPFRKAQTIKIRTGATKPSTKQSAQVSHVYKPSSEFVLLGASSLGVAETIIGEAIDFVIKRDREKELMKMMENYVK